MNLFCTRLFLCIHSSTMFTILCAVAALAAMTVAVVCKPSSKPSSKPSNQEPLKETNKSDILQRIAKQGISYETLLQDKKRLGML